jgi:hypothetical protein
MSDITHASFRVAEPRQGRRPSSSGLTQEASRVAAAARPFYPDWPPVESPEQLHVTADEFSGSLPDLRDVIAAWLFCAVVAGLGLLLLGHG